MLDWQDIQIFLEVARSQRLADAARRLGLDHSTVTPHPPLRAAPQYPALRA